MHRFLSFLAVSLIAASPLLAQHAGHGMGADAPAAPVTGQPPHLTQGWVPPVEDRMKFNYVLIDRLEFSSGDAADALSLDAEGWYGGDRNKFWWKAEGTSQLSGRGEGEGEVQALYSRLVAPFWNFQTGLRYDRTWKTGSDRGRTFAVFGFEGLAPYWFELEPTLFVSEHGDISASLAATYEVLLTQRLILQPRLDLNAALQDVPKFGVGSGWNNVELGVRLRYEITRQFSPYVGVTWRRALGGTASRARLSGEDISTISLVLGVRMWF